MSILDAKTMAREYDVALSARFKRYLDDKEWEKYEGRRASLPTYGDRPVLKLHGGDFDEYFEGLAGTSNATLGGEEGWVPFAIINIDEPQFLAAQATEKDCPVAMWEHENESWTPVAKSLDGFLKTLAK
jgi:hypothetical protein